MMMNTYKSFTQDSPYNNNIPYMLPLVNLEPNPNPNTIEPQNLLDFDTVTTTTTMTSYNFSNTNNAFLDYQNPSIMPINSYPFYNEALQVMPHEYNNPPLGIVKKEFDGFGGGRIGLNLGHRTYFSSADVLALDRIFGRSRGLYSLGHKPPRCQAEGCKVDLTGAKHYHRRHKVCEYHSKAVVVVIAGLQQRFCQQCSRFHVLAEFDETKRSCRKRLADHNRRRRKSSPDKNKQPTKSSKDIITNKSTTAPACTANIASANNIKGQDNYHNKENLFRINEPALSLGGLAQVEKGYQGQFVMTDINDQDKVSQQYLHKFSSSSNNDTNNYNHNSLFSANQSTEQGGSNYGAHQSNLLHLGQSMFEVDFL